MNPYISAPKNLLYFSLFSPFVSSYLFYTCGDSFSTKTTDFFLCLNFLFKFHRPLMRWNLLPHS